MNITSLKPGLHPEYNLIAFGDCLVTYAGTFLFPNTISEEPNSKVFNHGDKIFTVDDTEIPAPILFHEPTGIHTTRKEAEDIFRAHHLHLSRSLSKLDATLLIGHILHSLVADITFDLFPIKPGLHIQGHEGTGKSLVVSATLNLIGFHSHNPISLNSTNTAIERLLAGFSHLPLHFNEWSKSRANPATTQLFMGAYNNRPTYRGTAGGPQFITSPTPTASLIISGEIPITDAAFHSRFIHISTKHNIASGVPEALDTDKQNLVQVTRFLLQNYPDFRRAFAAYLPKTLQELLRRNSSPETRTTHNHAAIIAAYAAAHCIITDGENILPNLLNDIMTKLTPTHPSVIIDDVRGTAEDTTPTSDSPPLTSHSELHHRQHPPTLNELRSLIPKRLPLFHRVKEFKQTLQLSDEAFAAIETSCAKCASIHKANPDDTLSFYISLAAQEKIQELESATRNAAYKAYQYLSPKS